MSDAIEQFWSWWKTAAPKIEKRIEAQELGDLADEITVRVQAIEPDLKWEIGPGGNGKHAFALSWDGGIERRRLGQQWVAMAPSDPAWEFIPARPPGVGWENLTMELGGHRIEFSKFLCAFEIDEDRERVNVTVFHPDTVKAPENVRGTAAFVMLDRAFGEDGVERWLGGIELADKKPDDAVAISELVAAVAKLEAAATGDVCHLYEGKNDGLPMFVLKNEALKSIDHLDCDQQLAITLSYESGEHGLPTKAEAEALDALEDTLLETLGDVAAFHGRITGGGRRIVYLFATPAAEAVAKSWTQGVTREIEVEMTPDPTWEGLGRWG